MTTTESRNRDYERIWAGEYQREVTHFYSIGTQDDGDCEDFAYGYYTPDGYFHQGITRFDGESFQKSPR